MIPNEQNSAYSYKCMMADISQASCCCWRIMTASLPGILQHVACVDINKSGLCGYFRRLLMHLVFMSVFKRYRRITKYLRLAAQTCFHWINGVGKQHNLSFFPSGNGEELSPLILFPIFFSLRKEKKIFLKTMYLSLIRFQLYIYFFKPLLNLWASCEKHSFLILGHSERQFLHCPCTVCSGCFLFYYICDFFTNPILKSEISDQFACIEGH